MLLGFNMLLWSTHVTEEHFPLFAGIKHAGFDGVELPIFEGTPEHFRTIGRAIRDNGLRATAVTVIPDAERNCVSADPAVRSAGLDHLKWAIDCLAAAGGETLCGPFYQPLGVFTGEPPTKAERANVVNNRVLVSTIRRRFVSSPPNCVTSIPAQNALPAPVSTIAPVSSPPHASSASERRSRNSSERALRFSGRLRVSTATSP